jgi:hypothetical protein
MAGNYMPESLVSIDELADFEYDGVNYLYDLEPQQNNLFFAGNFNDGKEADGINGNFPFLNAQFRIQKVTLKMPALKFETHPQLKVPLIKSVEFAKEVKIQWVEDVYHSVQKYHFDWLCQFYNRNADCLRNGSYGKFRKMDVVLFHYRNSSDKNSEGDKYVESPYVEKVLSITLGGMIPEDYGVLDLDMKNDAGEQLVEISYKISKCYFLYNSALASPARGTAFDNERKPSDNLWEPTAASPAESKRASRTISSTVAGEGKLV